MIGLRTALEDQIETKKKDKEDKKDNWTKLLDHHKNMILNASSIGGKSRAPAPSGYLLEVINQSSFAESRSKASAMMKRQGARVNLLICLVKSLASGAWCNNNSDNPGNLSVFFIGLCDHLDDEENL